MRIFPRSAPAPHGHGPNLTEIKFCISQGRWLLINELEFVMCYVENDMQTIIFISVVNSIVSYLQ